MNTAQFESSKTPIIILSATEWQDNPVSTMHIASHLSQFRQVVFVETPGRRLPKWSELGRVFARLKKILKGAHQRTAKGLDPKNVYIFSPIAIPIPKSKIISKINAILLTAQLKKTLKKLNIDNPILWAFSPYWLDVVKQIPHQKLVFHCVDALHTYDASSQFKEKFHEIAKKADAVFTPGILIYKELKKINANTFHIGHGCSDLHLSYQKSEAPVELRNIPKPIAIYAGCLANWVDYDLLEFCAKKLPQVSFVLLGYVHALTPQESIQKILKLPNIYSLGYVNYERLPAFYHESDIGIVPYQADNEHIYYCTPTKIFDYLAAGLPCVSTEYPAASALQDYIKVAKNKEQFAEFIEDEINNNTAALAMKRHQYASAHNWPSQIDKMLRVIGGSWKN